MKQKKDELITMRKKALRNLLWNYYIMGKNDAKEYTVKEILRKEFGD